MILWLLKDIVSIAEIIYHQNWSSGRT